MKKEVNLKKFVKQLWFLLKPSRRKIFWLVFLVIIVEAIQMIGPYILKIIIDLILEFKAEDFILIAWWIGGMFLANQIASVFSYFKVR